MKAEVKFWPDTESLDLSIHAETDTELALLHLLRYRAPEWDESTAPEKAVRLTFHTGKAVAETGTKPRRATETCPV
jgi:hypothetical protein